MSPLLLDISNTKDEMLYLLKLLFIKNYKTLELPKLLKVRII